MDQSHKSSKFDKIKYQASQFSKHWNKKVKLRVKSLSKSMKQSFIENMFALCFCRREYPTESYLIYSKEYQQLFLGSKAKEGSSQHMNDIKCFLNYLFGDTQLWKAFKELLSEDHLRSEDSFLPDSIDGDHN
jgi:hypothetical protein